MVTRKYSDKQEKSIAKKVGGKTTPNSGGTKFSGGDVLTDTFLIEAKTSTKDKKSFSIKKEWLEKMQEQAFEQGKQNSALAIDFGDGKNYYLISEKLFKELVYHLEKEEYTSSLKEWKWTEKK